MSKDPEIRITKLPGIGYLVIKKLTKNNYFLSDDSTVVISVGNLYHLIESLVSNGYIDKKMLNEIINKEIL